MNEKQLHKFILYSCMFTVFWLGLFVLKPALVYSSTNIEDNKAYWFTIDVPFERLFTHTYTVENIINGAVVILFCIMFQQFGQYAFNNLMSFKKSVYTEILEKLK